MALLQWQMVNKFSEGELHRPPVVALSESDATLLSFIPIPVHQD